MEGVETRREDDELRGGGEGCGGGEAIVKGEVGHDEGAGVGLGEHVLVRERAALGVGDGEAAGVTFVKVEVENGGVGKVGGGGRDGGGFKVDGHGGADGLEDVVDYGDDGAAQEPWYGGEGLVSLELAIHVALGIGSTKRESRGGVDNGCGVVLKMCVKRPRWWREAKQVLRFKRVDCGRKPHARRDEIGMLSPRCCTTKQKS